MVLDDAPPVLEFPAPWRDLFRKSGRTLAEEFDRSAVALSAAEPATYVFADGAELRWPTDRGELFAEHEKAYGTAVAERWRRLVDQLDDVWQTVRKLGWEAELTGKAELTGPVRRRLQQDLTVADLAREIDHPHLGAVLRAGAYRHGGEPGDHARPGARSPQSIERRFGRWTLQSDCVDDQRDRTGRSSTLIDALVERARLRRVDLRLNERVDLLDLDQGRTRGVVTTHERLAAAAVIWTADPWQLPDAGLPRFRSRILRRRLRRLTPAAAPAVTHDLPPAADDWSHGRVQETSPSTPTASRRSPTDVRSPPARCTRCTTGSTDTPIPVPAPPGGGSTAGWTVPRSAAAWTACCWPARGPRPGTAPRPRCCRVRSRRTRSHELIG